MTEKENLTWDDFYRDNEVEKMPWYEKNLDLDVKKAINDINLKRGKFLDLGTGPGTQAMQLAKLGFDAVGSDLSSHAVNRAQKVYPDAHYVVDDILDSKFADKEFDFILDRGVFHVFEKQSHTKYLDQVTRILKKDGMLFLKCMSIEEKNMDGEGPYLYSKENLQNIFEKNFEIQSIVDTVYYGTITPLPKSLFAVMIKK